MQNKTIIYKHTIPDNISIKIRLLDYIIQSIPTIQSRNSAKKTIKKGLILLDGQPVESSRFIKPKQIIEHIAETYVSKNILELNLNIIYEDNYIAVVYKPAGISVSGNYQKTIQNTISYNLKHSPEQDVLPTALPVHRLDNPTSGILLIAKTQSAVIALGKQFQDRTIKKTYYAIVTGKPQQNGIISTPVDNKNAVTRFKVIKNVNSLKYKFMSLVELHPETGRTHQLRIHMSRAGFPITGDKLYSPKELLFKGKGLFLSAGKIEFKHPYSGENIILETGIPKKFTSLLKREQARWNQIHEK
jgi:RluA family pseudouridine synthase